MSNANWTRPPGPPNVWRTIDAVGKTKDGTSSHVRLSIQEIPENRYEEALDHMCEYFLADEVMCKCLKIKEDQKAVEDCRIVWDEVLKQGVSVAAYKLKSNGELDELIGINVLFVPTDQHEKRMAEIVANFKSTDLKKIFAFIHHLSGKFDVCKVYGADKCISGLGLSIKPSYRAQKLGVYLLEVREDIGRKYGIPVTSTVFMAPSSQIQAQRAGFQTVVTVKYAEAIEADGQPVFPGIEVDEAKLMVKQL